MPLAEAGAKAAAITGRNLDRVRALANACGAEPLPKEQAEARMFDALIHATPLGMAPRLNDCYFENRIPAKIVFDMVYNPLETLLVRRAKAPGATVCPGISLFLEQAARQFVIFTEASAP